MNNYLNSSYIKMYPSALRGGTDIKEGSATVKQIYDPESRLTTEANITSLVNRLSIDGSFVISEDITGGIEFSIKGYLFNITYTGLTGLLSGADTSLPLYAVIRMANLGQEGTPYVLRSLVPYTSNNMNLDVEDTTASETTFNFQGVYFTQTESETTGTDKYSLKILEYNSTSKKWTIPHDSILRFNAEAIKIADEISLHDVIYQNSQSKTEIKVDEFVGHLTGNVDATIINSTEVNSHLTGNVKGDLTGNAKTATDSSYAALIGTSSSHPSIGSNNNPIYIDGNGKAQAGMNIFVSSGTPSSSDGKDGDIWFQYAG